MTTFPSNPTVGDITTIANIKYMWNGSKWIIVTGAIVNNIVQSNTGSIDLSKGNYHKITLDETNTNVTVNFSNIPSGASRWTIELTGNGKSWSVSTASYTNNFASVGSQEAEPYGLFFKPDGTKMYVLGNGSDRVFEYNLSTAWSVSTAVYSGSFYVGSQDATPTGLFFKPDGTKMYVVGFGSDRVFEYNLSTAWSVSTAVYSGNSFYVGSQDTTPIGLFFKPDGTKMYVVGTANDRVYEYNLSTPWAVSTAVYSGSFASVGSQDTNPYGLFFKPDGTKMYVVGSTNDRVFEYNLSTAWSVSTAVYSGNSFYVVSQDATPTGLFFKPDGTKMYVLGYANKRVFEYDTGTSFGFNWPSNLIWKNNTPPTVAPNQTIIVDFYSPDGGTTIYGIQKFNNGVS